MTLRAVSVSAPPTQRDPAVSGVRLEAGVTTPPLAARYRTHTLRHTQIHTLRHTQIHTTHTHADTHRYTLIQKLNTLLVVLSAVQVQ